MLKYLSRAAFFNLVCEKVLWCNDAMSWFMESWKRQGFENGHMYELTMLERHNYEV